MTDKLTEYTLYQQNELKAAGWKKENGTGRPPLWRSPAGRLWVGTLQAWQQMKREVENGDRREG